MKPVLVLVAVLGCFSLLSAQQPAPALAVTTDRDGKWWTAKIKNNTGSTLTAFALWVTFGTSSGGRAHTVYVDSALETRSIRIPPQSQAAVFHSEVELAAAQLQAGIFADGSTFGDVSSVRLLLQRRRNMLLSIETILQRFADATTNETSREQLAAQFRSDIDLLRRWYVPDEQRVGLPLYETILETLARSEPLDSTTAMLIQRRAVLLQAAPGLAITPEIIAGRD